MAACEEGSHISATHRYKGIMFPNHILDSSIDALQTFEVRQDDVWILTYPKSGTHWMMEIVGLIFAEGNPDKIDRSLFSSTIYGINCEQKLPRTRKEELAFPVDMTPFLERIKVAKSPRIIWSHLQPHLLPPDLMQRAKVIYLARNPKDVINAYYNFKGSNLLLNPRVNAPWEHVLEAFMAGDDFRFGSWSDHVRAFWKLRDEENFLFLFYEDMKKNIKNTIQRIAHHLGRSLTEESLQLIIEKSSFEEMKKTYQRSAEAAAKEGIINFTSFGGSCSYVNKGTVGQWKDSFTAAQNEVFDKWYQDKMADTNIEFTFEA